MSYKSEFITFMAQSGVLTFGDFTTKSGRKTPYFINTGNYKAATEEVQQAFYKVSEKLYQQANPQGQPGAGAQPGDDGVVDADYETVD